MKKRIALRVILAFCVAPNVLSASPLLELPASNPRDVIRFQIDGLPALSNPDYKATLAPSRSNTLTISDATAFVAPVEGVNFALQKNILGDCLPGPDVGPCTSAYVVVGELLPAEAPEGSTLLVGIDANADGLPQMEETRCRAQVQAAASAQCLIRLNVQQYASTAYWVMVQAPAGSNASTVVHHAAFHDLPPSYLGPGYNGDLVITGPGRAAAGASLSLRLSSLGGPYFNTEPSQRYYGAVSVDATWIPFALTATSANNDISLAMTPYQDFSGKVQSDSFTWSRSLHLAPGETLKHFFFDIPPALDGVGYADSVFQLNSLNGATWSDIDAYLVRTDFPPRSSSATVDAAPSPDASVIYWSATLENQILPLRLSAGRWYVVVTNRSANYVSLSAAMASASYRERLSNGANPPIAPGFYYNPLRSGHGISVSQGGDQQVVNWFTYLEDGTPQWYEAQAVAPRADSGWWQAPLYRVAWNGAHAHLTQVGGVTLTPVATNEFMFTWHLEGRFGSERFTQLARTGDCPVFNGVTTNFGGAWYAPTLSGYGMDVLSLPEQQFATFYFYDDLGLARWGVGSSLPFSASSTMTFNQNIGFCPSCTFTPVTAQTLGTIDIDYASSSAGNLSTNLVLKAPLSGTWSYSKPMARLTGSAACVE